MKRNENNNDEKFYDINISLVLPKISIRFVFLVTNTEKRLFRSIHRASFM